ncbi:dicarboxylate/amino acid:cation symporter [Succinimonas amylolytica]|uniref:dicarboxylate/amino acid:cation symporter n=1 Tax=Succinimonas amylolytica TaxID=83769 RepID=UPI0023A7D0DD
MTDIKGDTSPQEKNTVGSSWKYALAFTVAVLAGVLNGWISTRPGLEAARFLSEVFIRLFKFVSVPVIGVTICLTIAELGSSKSGKSLWQRTLFYTLTTTLAAATVAAVLYHILSSENISLAAGTADPGIADKKSYLEYFTAVVPDNPLAPLVDGKVLSILLIAIAVGIAIRCVPSPAQKETLKNFLGGVQSVIFTIIKWIIAVLPLGIFGFVSLCVYEFSKGISTEGIGTYFSVVIGSNLIQGLVILPLFLLAHRINPVRHFAGMFQALVVAFFSKSSAGTLPVTISCAENKLHLNPRVTRFTLPICTTINMNGCAAFILTTEVYLMQNNGTVITPGILAVWVVIATVAAIGNAGVPMGCYLLSASLLASMDVPIVILGIILPVYAVLDMLETALNVFSDSCVAAMVDRTSGKDAGAAGTPIPEKAA